jgi:hypothetical protein
VSPYGAIPAAFFTVRVPLFFTADAEGYSQRDARSEQKTRFVLQAEQWQDGGVQRKGQNIQVLASVVQAMPSTT